MTISNELFNRAKKVLPGGVNSPVRAFGAVGGTPPFILSAKGCYLMDADGNQYVDYIGSWGPMILGHAHEDVVDALEETIGNGTSFGAPSPLEVELAEEITNRVPSVEMIRFVNSGTEATMSAIRLARAATGRDTIIKFSGCYHGHADSFLIQAGSGVATFGLPNSPGVTEGAAKDTRVAEFNNIDSVRQHFEAEPESIAAVIIEPVAGNMGVVPPQDGFLRDVKTICEENGALLIFDEVMTGFRVHPGGAQELYGVTPDLTTFGKIIGGGLPVGAYGGKRVLMEMIAPVGAVYQAGTLSGNPLAMAAGLATIRELDEKLYDHLETVSATLETGLRDLASRIGIDVILNRVGSMLTLFFTDKPVTCFADAQKANHKKFARFFQEMLSGGIHLPPSGYEAWFLSAAHGEDEIARTLEVAEKVFDRLG